MTKTLGCKVEDGLYYLFRKLEGSVSDNLRKAAIMYYNHTVNNSVDPVNPAGNQKEKSESYEDISEKVDCLIRAYFKDSDEGDVF